MGVTPVRTLSSMYIPLHFKFILLLVLLSAASSTVHAADIPTFGIDAIVDNTTGAIKYLVNLKLAPSPSTSADEATQLSFALDTDSNKVTLSSKCKTKLDLWGFLSGDGSVTASTFDHNIATLTTTCGNSSTAGMGSKPTSLPVQVSKAQKLPLRFGYRVSDNGGLLLIGKSNWVQFISIIPEVIEVISFISIPMKMDDPSSSYMVKLTGIGYTSFLIRQKDYLEVSTTERFTTLPRKMYNFVLGQFQHDVVVKKIRDAGDGYGKLRRCYNMKSSDVKGFRNITMVFNSKLRWVVPADKYLVPRLSSSGNIYCFGFVEAPPEGRGVIGTLQQEGRAIEYNLVNKTLNVSPVITGSFFSP